MPEGRMPIIYKLLRKDGVPDRPEELRQWTVDFTSKSATDTEPACGEIVLEEVEGEKRKLTMRFQSREMGMWLTWRTRKDGLLTNRQSNQLLEEIRSCGTLLHPLTPGDEEQKRKLMAQDNKKRQK